VPPASCWPRRTSRPGTRAALDKIPRIVGWGHRTAGLPLAEKLRRSAGQPLLLPHLAQALSECCQRAGLAGPAELSGLEVHDCFSITEYVIADHLGLLPPGQVHRAIEEGWHEPGGRLPINPSGGLIGGGHPVGASGVRMVWDAARQVSGTAGDCQVGGARRFGTLNLGGSATTVVAFVVEGGEVRA
jgi:acetyl-CoA C-acetyltransferase